MRVIHDGRSLNKIGDFQKDYVDNLNCQGSSKRGGDSDSTRDTGRGCLEVRTSPVKVLTSNALSFRHFFVAGKFANAYNFRQFRQFS